MASLVKQFSGRKRQSVVWNYVEDRPDIAKCWCIVLKLDGKPCHVNVTGKNAANMKAHLQSHHEKVYWTGWRLASSTCVSGIRWAHFFCLWHSDKWTPQQDVSFIADEGMSKTEPACPWWPVDHQWQTQADSHSPLNMCIFITVLIVIDW